MGTKNTTEVNPATGEELAQVVVSTPEDVDRAVAAAHTSFYETREWRDMDSQTRGDFLLRIADLIAEAREELAYLDAVDMGKPLREAEGDVDDATVTAHKKRIVEIIKKFFEGANFSG